MNNVLTKFRSNKWLSLSLKVIIFASVFTGLLLTVISTISSRPIFASLFMYTDMSNFIVLIEYGILIVLILLNRSLNKRWISVMRLSCNCALILTFLIFGLLLTPASLITGEYNPFEIKSIFKHFVSPILMLIDYFVVDREHTQLKKYDFLYGFAISAIYIIVIMIRGHFSTYPSVRRGGVESKYPYFFLDPYFMGIWFEGGNLKNVHLGVVPIIALLVMIDSGMIFGVSMAKNKIQDNYLLKTQSK